MSTRRTLAAVTALATFATLATLAACTDASLPTSPAPAAASRSLTAATTGTATAVSLSSGLNASLCVDVSGARTTPGTNVIVWTCADQTNQQFTPNSSGEIRTIGGLCLDAAGGAGRNGDVVITWTCTGGANQQWTLTAQGQVVGINGKCLDLPASVQTPGRWLIIWTCNGGANQRWVTTAVGSAPAPSAPSTPSTPSTPSNPAGVQPTLPQATVDVTMPAQTGRTINVPAGGDLQAALNTASPGDVITLAPGATYRGNFYLWPRSGSGTIVVRTAVPDAALPAPGTRMTPARAAAANLARIVSNRNGPPAIATNPGSSNWRFTGLEIGVDPSVTIIYDIVALGTSGTDQQTLAQVPSNIVLDRVWIHGTPTLGFSRCVALNSANTAIVDSYISDCHLHGGEAQGIAGWNGPGPYLIQNNYIEGSAENLIFGGSDPSIPNLIPSDITIRGNSFYKPLSWKGVWSVKNLLELKIAQRVLVEGNVFDGSWADAQSGYAWVIKSSNDGGGANWAVTRDVTLRRNWVRNVGAGINFSSQEAYSGGTAQPVSRIRIEQNVFERVNANGYNGAGRFVQFGGGPVAGPVTGTSDVNIVNNTFAGTGGGQSPFGDGISHFIVFGGPSHSGLVVSRNVALAGMYGVVGDSQTRGTASLAQYAPGAVFDTNLLVGEQYRSLYPAGTLFTADPGSTWAAPGSGLWTLLGGLGSNLGADVTAVLPTLAAAQN